MPLRWAGIQANNSIFGLMNTAAVGNSLSSTIKMVVGGLPFLVIF
jgi:hypothetical protein